MFIFLLLSTAPLITENQAPAPVAEIQGIENKIPLFNPPPGWQCALPKNHSPYVRVGFIGNGSTQFHPSINLASEEVDISQKEYVKAVKEIHLAEPGTKWRDLGKFSMNAGVGILTEISSTSVWGEVKMLQAILVQKKTAYILTAAVLKKDYPGLQKEILKSLQSFSLHPTLIAALPSEQLQDQFKQIFSTLGIFTEEGDVSHLQKSQWEQYQKQVTELYPEMGSHWQFLALREGHTKIYSH